jgi:glucose/arabinose dehydrogenase
VRVGSVTAKASPTTASGGAREPPNPEGPHPGAAGFRYGTRTPIGITTDPQPKVSKPVGAPALHRLLRVSVLAGMLVILVTGTAAGQDPPTERPDRFLGKSAAERRAATAEVAPMAATTGFQDTVAISGLTSPTVVRFAPDGRVFVAEKNGRIKSFPSLADTTPTTIADLRANVHDYWDRGLLGFAIDPGFPERPYLYALYTYDALPGGSAPRWGTPTGLTDPCPTPPGPTADGCVVQGRLSRLVLGPGGTGTATEQVLIEDWCQQFPSHSVGGLAFGADGALYATAGEGANFIATDYGQYGGSPDSPTPKNPCGDPPGGVGGTMTSPTAQGGALRSQDRLTTGDATGLSGTVIRVDPDTGLGLPSNPGAASADANIRRIVAHGLRNPFRLAIRPGTSEVWVGDVGWLVWEEIDRIADPTAGVRNFGWPCYEGPGQLGSFDDFDLCLSLYGTAGAHTAPYFAYDHSSTVVAGDACPTGTSAIAGLAFYADSGPYPAQYDGALFFADYSRDCIWAMRRGTNGLPDPSQRETFVASAANPVDLTTGPNGDLFYVNLDGEVRRISYVGSNIPPTAAFTATPQTGEHPLTVTFDATASSDPEGGVLTYSWDLDGNGVFGDATGATPTRTYTEAGTITVRLRVTDFLGATDETSRLVSVSNAPPVPTISAPSSTTTWSVGTDFSFSGSASDAQDGTLAAAALSWRIILHHCPGGTCHSHPIETRPGIASGTFVAPDHEYPSHLEFELTATDSTGLSASTSVLVHPKTVDLSFATAPRGLPLTVGGATSTAPFTRTAIVGSRISIGAASELTIPRMRRGAGGVTYRFVAWSNGGARNQEVIAGPSPTTYTATFSHPPAADLSVTKSGSRSGRKLAAFRLEVRNAGPSSAAGVVLTDPLPAQLRLSGPIGTTKGTCSYASSTRRITCALGTLATGASVRITFRATVWGDPTWVSNRATVTSTTAEAWPSNNASTVRVRLR